MYAVLTVCQVKGFQNKLIWLDLSVICIFFPSCIAWGIWRSLFSPSLMGTEGLRSIWLTWKQLCFHRSDWGFIAAPSKPGFSGPAWLNNVKSHVCLSITVARKHCYCPCCSSCSLGMYTVRYNTSGEGSRTWQGVCVNIINYSSLRSHTVKINAYILVPVMGWIVPSVNTHSHTLKKIDKKW